MVVENLMWNLRQCMLFLAIAFASLGMTTSDAFAQYELLLGADADRNSPVSLDGATVAGDIFVFTSPDTGVRRVFFYIDDPTQSGPYFKREGKAPYDLNGTMSNGQANAFDTNTLSDGSHTITARVELSAGGNAVVTATVTISNSGPALVFTPGSVLFNLDPNQIDSGSVSLDTNDATVTAVTFSGGAPWLGLTIVDGITPESVMLDVDSSGLAPGSYNTLILADANGYLQGTLNVTLQVASPPGVYDIVVSTSNTRLPASSLSGQSVSGNIFVYTTPDTDVDKVVFSFDGAVIKTEKNAPYDMQGGSPLANPFDTTSEIDGPHTVSAAVLLNNGSTINLSAPFAISNNVPSLVFSPTNSSANIETNQMTQIVVGLDASDLSNANFTVTEGETWLTATPATGTTPASITLDLDSTGLADGTYNATVLADANGLLSGQHGVTLTVGTAPPVITSLLLSLNPTRSSAVPLEGSVVSGDVFIFTSPDTGVAEVSFFIDGVFEKRERNAPYDLAGGNSDGTAKAFNATALSNGFHTISAEVTFDGGGMETVTATVSTPGVVPALTFDAVELIFSLDPNTNPLGSDSSILSTSDFVASLFTLSESAAWLDVDPNTGTTAQSIIFNVDASSLTPGTHQTVVSATSPTHATDTILVTVTIGTTGSGNTCSPLTCAELRVDDPYGLTFDEDRGKILDKNGVGSGFTYIQPTTNGTGYIPNNLEVDLANGTFEITTTAGIFKKTNDNDADNVIGIGIDVPGHVPLLSTTMVNIPAGTGNFEQAGLWFGIDEDNYHKLAIVSRPEGAVIEHHQELGGANADRSLSNVVAVAGVDVTLILRVDPNSQTVSSEYRVGGGLPVSLATYTSPPEMFSFDQAGIDPIIGTRSFGGIYATHRKGPASVTYTFDDFVLLNELEIPAESEFEFVEKSFGSFFPTAMIYGPDDRLYVASLFGTINAYTLDPNNQPIATETINTLGSRLTLGLTVDPDSDPNNVILWAAHSNASIDNGAINSSTVTKLTGPGHSIAEDVITGLPRAIANHAINHIHFGPDGKLYIAVGGNTGAGGKNNAGTEFGNRAEQPLSAAILIADVKAPGFDGTCDNSSEPGGIFGPNPCDVVTHATGIRNSYDFWFHSSGQMFATDNGLGVSGSFPPSPTPVCDGNGSITPWDQGGNNPGQQPDLLLRIQQGKYYGHPNPSRDECVFKDGSFQGPVAPLPNYEPPFLSLGDHLSANGILEFMTDGDCSPLEGQLIISNFSQGNNLIRVQVSADGLTPIESGNLKLGLASPLPLALRKSDGTIFAGETGSGGKILALTLVGKGCWQDGLAPLPVNLLDPGSAAFGGKIYLIGGKLSSGAVSTVHIYDPNTNLWSLGMDRPGAAVEDAAIAVDGGFIYAMGGSLEPFTGQSTAVDRYDPVANTWAPMASMGTPRGGATAQAIGGKVYIAGGTDASGDSVDSVEVYDIASNMWSSLVAPMGSVRDHPMSAVHGGKMYVFGGRIRAGGTTVNGELNTVEMYDPATDVWTPRAAMPSGRRTGLTGIIRGKIHVLGGEKTPQGGAFASNEAYDPTTDTWEIFTGMQTPRQGYGGGVVNGQFYVIGGGTSGGSSFSNINESYGF